MFSEIIFSKAHIYKEIRCPDCNSPFVAEIHDLPKSLEKTNVTEAIPTKETSINIISSESDVNVVASDIEGLEYEEHSGHGSIGKDKYLIYLN